MIDRKQLVTALVAVLTQPEVPSGGVVLDQTEQQVILELFGKKRFKEDFLREAYREVCQRTGKDYDGSVMSFICKCQSLGIRK